MNIFNSDIVSTESWALQGAVVMWSMGAEYAQSEGTKGIPLVMNQIQVRYGVPVSTFTPLNTDNDATSATRILIKGVPEGTLTVQSIFTPSVSNLTEFLEATQALCKTPSNQVNLSIRPFAKLKCSVSNKGETAKYKPGDITFYLSGLDLRQFDFTISQQDQIAMTSMPLTFQFFGLAFDAGSGGSAGTDTSANAQFTMALANMYASQNGQG